MILNQAILALLLTNLWILVYRKLLTYLNLNFPAQVGEDFLWVQSEPEPYEIPIFLILSSVIVLIIFLVKKFVQKEIKLPINIKIVFFLLLLLVFIVNLGPYPMSGEIDPYKIRSNSSIYFTIPFFYLLFFGLIIFFSRYLNKYLLAGLIFVVLALLTFDPGFPITGHDYEYFIGPSYEVASGKTVYTDILSRYSFLSIDLFAMLHKLKFLDLYYIPAIVWILYILQYFLCFILLLKISRSRTVALLGTFSILTVNYFSLSHLPAVIPQIGPLRWFPMILLIWFFYQIKSPSSWKLMLAISIFSFLMIDVGIAILLAYLETLLLLWLNKQLKFIALIKNILTLAIFLISILLLVNLLHLLLGLKPVDILTPFYSFKKHAVLGLSLIPMTSKTYFWFVPLIYFASIICFFKNSRNQETRNKQISNINESNNITIDKWRFWVWKLLGNWRLEIGNSENKLLLFSANISLFSSIYFVGRSHPHNLFNISLFPLLNLFILLSFVLLYVKNRFFLVTCYCLLVTLFIVIPTFQRRFTLTEMLLNKYSRLTGGNIFESEVNNIVKTKYKTEIELINDNLPDKTIILSSDDTYLFYATGKKNLLDANPILGIDLPEDLDFAVKNAVKACPEKIAVDCSYLNKCPSYTPFVGVKFNLDLILNKLESACKIKYQPSQCTDKLCITKVDRAL